MSTRIFSFIIILFLVIADNSYSQNLFLSNKSKNLFKEFQPIHANTFSDSITSDTLYIKKRFWRASGELLLVELIPWSYNRFVRDAEFAKISWESIKYNLDFSNWVWDDNTFVTNQFAHPYHGSLYFSAFRTNGYSFWQSFPAAWAGSYIWEVAGESHPASPNDLLNTSLGGISLGEMSFRFSNLIVNNRQVGFRRQMNEVLGFLVNPLNGLNRIIDGRWGRYQSNIPDRVPSHLGGNLDVGYRRISQDVADVFTKGKNEFFVRATIQYGNPFEEIEKPFSNFTLIGELGASDSATLNNIQVTGFLYGNEVKSNDKGRSLFAITMNYDYIKNTSIQYGGQSFSLKYMSDAYKKNNSHLYAEAGVIGVVIAAVPDDYLLYGEGRNYDFGPGAGLLAGGKLDINHKFWWNINYKGIWFTSVDGNDADFFLHNLSTDLRYFFNDSFSFTVQAGYFEQDSNYEDFEDVIREYPYGRIGLGYAIGSGLK